MAEIDAFATLLLEEAKRFLEIAIDTNEPERSSANLHAAIMVSFAALEAHVNAMCEELSGRPELTVHEKALLLEKDVKLDRGEFRLSGFKMNRLEDRMSFLQKHFSGKDIDKTSAWWANLASATNTRNKLIHPKHAHVITTQDVTSALRAIIEAINSLYLSVYRKKFPALRRGLSSKLTF